MSCLPFLWVGGHGDLIERSRLEGRKVFRFGTRFLCRLCEPDVKSCAVAQTSSRWIGAQVWRGRCQFRCHPRHVTAAQNYEVRPDVALVLLYNGR
ncbi:hypothetical protein AVEN_167960-1 [Araneus ventricosus]|uniref:Uncharacterized protein n=1 Tax=Araneus ventricosus TaxID=182803 RepID=A0A4Y2WK22_ARAVE|nr:hypothetical protein AVEN_167960-1 [Araneus ventricosus]